MYLKLFSNQSIFSIIKNDIEKLDTANVIHFFFLSSLLFFFSSPRRRGPEKPSGHGLNGPSRDKALGTRTPRRVSSTTLAFGSCDKVLIMFLTSKPRVIL